MNPWPIVHTELVILKLLMKRLPTQILSLLYSVICVGGVVFLALTIKKGLFTGTTLKALTVSNVAPAALLALAAFLVFSSCSGLMWRNADRKLLAGSPVSSLPVVLLLQGMIYILLIASGGGVITFSALHYLSPRLASLGLVAPWDQVILIIPLALAYGALFLRLALLLPLIGLDRQKAVPGWHLVMRTTVGKSIPLGVGILVQLLLCSPFYIAFALVVLPSFQSVPLSQMDVSYLTAHLSLTLLGVLLLASAYVVLTTLQAAMLRHFFGYGLAGDPRYDDDHIVLAEEYLPGTDPVLIRDEEPYLMAPPVLQDTSLFTEDEPESGLAPPSSFERLDTPSFEDEAASPAEAPFFDQETFSEEKPFFGKDTPTKDEPPLLEENSPLPSGPEDTPLLPEGLGPSPSPASDEDDLGGFNFDVAL